MSELLQISSFLLILKCLLFSIFELWLNESLFQFYSIEF